MVWRALQADFGMSFGGDLSQHRLAQPRFAEPWFAGQQKELTLTGGRDAPPIEHQREFGIPSDKLGGGRVAGGAKAAGVVTGRDHLPSHDAGADTLQGERIYCLKIE